MYWTVACKKFMHCVCEEFRHSSSGRSNLSVVQASIIYRGQESTWILKGARDF